MHRPVEFESGKGSVVRRRRNPLDTAGVRIAVLLGLFTVAALYQASQLSALTDPDIWWHLRTGTWMLQNHAIPHDGLFSQSASLPWVDPNWGFDLLVATSFKVFGLRGLPVLLMALQAAIAAALFLLAGGRQKNFWQAALLAAVAQYCISGLKPSPALVSILFFALELTLLLDAGRSRQIRTLFWMPLLFIVWVNLDRQFVYGLLALLLFYGAIVADHLGRRFGSPVIDNPWFDKHGPHLPLGATTAVLGACLLATLVSPYTYHLHQLIWQGATNTAADHYLPEFHSMRFRQPQDYLLMLLVMTSCLALGRRRSRDLFQISLLVVCAAISFRFQRDTWLVTLVAAGIIGSAFPTDAQEEQPAWRWERLLTTALVLVILAAGTLRLPTRNEVLMAKVGATFPARASDYIHQNRLPQPLFNSYYWGGFLTWYLPEYPVVIDGRMDLYGEANNLPYFKLTEAEIPLESHPGFAQAQTFLLETKSPIAEALATLPGFRIAYRDDLACVLVRRD